MVKRPKKHQGNSNAPQNTPNPNSKLDGKLSKSRQQINQQNYQKSKEKRKEKRRVRYQQQKELTEKQEKEQLSKYYGAEAFKILMPFKTYTELIKEKQQLWLDFNWTLKDCQESIKEGYADIVAIMKLEQVSNKLVRDYWDTAKSEKERKEKSWKVLSQTEQDQLIKYWGREKANIENGYIEEEEKLERQGDSYLKEIERAKFHEERGKVKCPCGWCEQARIIHGEVEAKIRKETKQAEKEFDDYWGVGDKNNEKSKCENCGKVKKLVEDAALCKKCYEDYDI